MSTNQFQHIIPTISSLDDLGAVKLPFPCLLHNLLASVENAGLAGIISWQPHGQAFRVHKRKDFERQVMKQYFNQSVYKSFQRQLHMYSFKRVSEGLDKGAYYHSLFVRDKPEFCLQMKRLPKTKRGIKATAAATEEQGEIATTNSIQQASTLRQRSFSDASPCLKANGHSAQQPVSCHPPVDWYNNEMPQRDNGAEYDCRSVIQAPIQKSTTSSTGMSQDHGPINNTAGILQPTFSSSNHHHGSTVNTRTTTEAWYEPTPIEQMVMLTENKETGESDDPVFLGMRNDDRLLQTEDDQNQFSVSGQHRTRTPAYNNNHETKPYDQQRVAEFRMPASAEEMDEDLEFFSAKTPPYPVRKTHGH